MLRVLFAFRQQDGAAPRKLKKYNFKSQDAYVNEQRKLLRIQ